MIICKSCCETRCAKKDNCPILPTPYYGEPVCQVCGQPSSTCLYCAFYLPADNEVAECSVADRLLSLLRPVAETLADREAKYGGAYHELRQRYDPIAFCWEVEKKLRRYVRCLKNRKYEAAEDSLIDIIGYAVLEMEILRASEFRKEGTD